MNILVVLNDPPYGTERSYNGLRLAGALSRREGVNVRVFLFGDATVGVAGGRVSTLSAEPLGESDVLTTVAETDYELTDTA